MGEMPSDFGFDKVIDAPQLPYNYLPSRLSSLRGDPGPKSRIVLSTQRRADGIAYSVAGSKELSDPVEWKYDFESKKEDPKQRVVEERITQDTSFRRSFPQVNTVILGPPVEKENDSRIRTINFRQAPLLSQDDGKDVILVIDYGIAFWNRRFRNQAGECRFREIQFLDFDPDTDTNPIDTSPIGFLDAADIASFCATADAQGHGPVVNSLSQTFGRSFYGTQPDLDHLWHGTAMADLAGGADPQDGADTILFGLELPTSSVRDRSGDTLQSVMPSALAAGLAMTSAYEDRPLVIVLAFAFPAGPHDGSHPIASAIADFLETDRLNGRDVTLMLPAGNHLQDRCCARLPATGSNTDVPSVFWHVPPDDFSVNTVEICVDAPENPTLVLTAPYGETAEITLAQGQIASLLMNGAEIGGVHNIPSFGSKTKLRLSLAATAWQSPSVRPPPYGNWRIGIKAQSDADLWILRDDTTRDETKARPNRASFFADHLYEERDRLGNYGLDDTSTGMLRRSGTASIMTTGGDPAVVAVQANERLGTNPIQQAMYSGRHFDGSAMTREELVDDGWTGRGTHAVGNGTDRVFSVSGSSSAAALAARRQAALP